MACEELLFESSSGEKVTHLLSQPLTKKKEKKLLQHQDV